MTVVNYIFGYLDAIKAIIKDQGKLQFFEELKLMADTSFKYYQIPDPVDNVTSIAVGLIFTRNANDILKETYGQQMIKEIDPSDIVKYLEEMSY